MRERYLEAVEEVKRWYAVPRYLEEILSIIPLVRNGKFLLLGPYGYGKSLYAYLVGRVVFGLEMEEMAVVNLMNELTIYDVFFHVDVGALMKGEEVVEPRNIITSPFKFVNELQRGNSRIYNALLGLMAEGEIRLRERMFRTPDYLMILDANPFDAASTEIPRALLDRITGSFTMRSLEPEGMMKVMDMKSWDPRGDARPILGVDEMRKIWEEVEAVEVPRAVKTLMLLIHRYLNQRLRAGRQGALLPGRAEGSLQLLPVEGRAVPRAAPDARAEVVGGHREGREGARLFPGQGKRGRGGRPLRHEIHAASPPAPEGARSAREQVQRDVGGRPHKER